MTKAPRNSVGKLALALLASTLGLGMPAEARPLRPTPEVDVVTSTADGRRRVEATTARILRPTVTGPLVTIRTDEPRQRVRGVGAALTESSAYLIARLPPGERRRLLRTLFDPRHGGLSVVRIVIGASDFSLSHQSLADSPLPDPELSRFSIDRDRVSIIPVLKEILDVNPRVTIVASPWSAPGWMKNTGSYTYGILDPQYERVYAQYLVRFVEEYRREGVAVRWLTIQNEPAALQFDYPSMVMFPDQQLRVVQDHLAPLLRAAGLLTRVLGWDHNWCDARPPGGCVSDAPATFPLQVLDSPGATEAFAGTAFHCYGGQQALANDTLHAAHPELEIWQTECSGGTWQATPFQDTAQLLVTGRGHWENASLLWNLALDASGGPHLGGCGTCRGVVTIDPERGTWIPNLDFDALATVTRFGPRGSRVVSATVTDAPDIVAAAQCAPDGRPAVIVANRGGRTTVTLDVDGFRFAYSLEAASLTAVRAPRGIACARNH